MVVAVVAVAVAVLAVTVVVAVAAAQVVMAATTMVTQRPPTVTQISYPTCATLLTIAFTDL
jgi:hypothetical protein